MDTATTGINVPLRETARHIRRADEFIAHARMVLTVATADSQENARHDALKLLNGVALELTEASDSLSLAKSLIPNSDDW